MSKIDELIAEKCPDGVSYYNLTDVAHYVRGITYSKKDEQVDGPIRVLRANNITLSSNTLNLKDIKLVSEHVRVREDQRLLARDILICAGSGSKEHIGKVAFISEDRPETFGGFMGVVRAHSKVEPRFLFHIMTGEAFLSYLRRTLSSTTINNLNARVMQGFRLPVPPLEVQCEIVKILDTFSALEAELEAELETRTQQYEYYRGQLLSDRSSGDQELTLGEIFDMRAGSYIKASEIQETQSSTHPYPCFGGNGIRGYVSTFSHNADLVLIGRQGALCGNVQRASGKIYATEHAVVVTPKLDVDMNWAFHKLTEMDLNQYKTKSAQPGLAVGRLKDLAIKLPSLIEQQRIAEILDKTHALVNDFSTGLPAEITARRQQYEYYRDRLLTFEESEVSA